MAPFAGGCWRVFFVPNSSRPVSLMLGTSRLIPYFRRPICHSIGLLHAGRLGINGASPLIKAYPKLPNYGGYRIYRPDGIHQVGIMRYSRLRMKRIYIPRVEFRKNARQSRDGRWGIVVLAANLFLGVFPMAIFFVSTRAPSITAQILRQ